MRQFEKALEELKLLHLPTNEYVVVGVCCFAIYNLRDTADIDILVTKELWDELVFKHPITQHENYQSINIKNVEILGGVNPAWTPNGFIDVLNIILNSKQINNINYASLEYIKHVKLKLNRPKDLIDIELIDEFLGLHTVL